MAATKWPTSHSPLLNRLRADFPAYNFCDGDEFRWASTEDTIYFIAKALATTEGIAQLLHELGHAELDHRDYTRDVQLLRMEAEAWQRALELAVLYKVQLPDTYVQECLDSYREWLHARSTCPTCGQNGIQKNKRTYQCLNCGCAWRVNDAKLCALRRYRSA